MGREYIDLRECLKGAGGSLRASSPFGGYREKYTRERHVRGDATAGGGEEKGRASSPFAARSRVRARLSSPAQIGELARRLRGRRFPSLLSRAQFPLTLPPKRNTERPLYGVEVLILHCN